MIMFFVLCVSLGFVFGLLAFLLPTILSTTLDIKNLAEAFQAFSYGCAALIGAITLFPELYKKLLHYNLVNKYRRKYRISELNNGFRLVFDPNCYPQDKQVYLIDDRDKPKTRHHVANYPTLDDLSLYKHQILNNISKVEFNSCVLSEIINTRLN